MSHRLLALLLCSFVAIPALADSIISLHPSARFVLPTPVGPDVLRQCSRSTPTNVSGYWEPTQKQIEALETRLLIYLAARAKSGETVPPGSIAYRRQYVGIISDGTYLIYGNFYPNRREDSFPMEATAPVLVCDGGSVFWGIAHDIKSGAFMKPDFNGSA